MTRKPIGDTLGTGCLGLFAIPFAVGGLLIALAVLGLALLDIQTLPKTATPCTILHTELIEKKVGQSTLRTVQAKYGYSVAGIDYTSENVSAQAVDSPKQFHAELLEHQQSGKPYVCYVNPQDPKDAVLYRDVPWHLAALLVVAAVLFGGVGFGLLGLVAYHLSPSRPDRPVYGEGLAPWERRADWASGEIRHSDRTVGRWLTIAGLVIIALSIPSIVAATRALVRNHELWALLGYLPTGAGWLLFTAGRKRTRRWRQFGTSTFKLARVPGVIGGRLAGAVQVEGCVNSPDGYSLKLYCTETRRSSGSKKSSQVQVVSQQEITVAKPLYASELDGTAIPVIFHVAMSAPETSDAADAAYRWRMEVRSIDKSVDYVAEFEVPLFRTAESSHEVKSDDEDPIDGFLATNVAEAPIELAGVIDEPIARGERIVFPRFRNLGFAIGLALVQTIFGVGVVVAIYVTFPTAWPFIAAIIGYGLLTSYADLALYQSQIDVTSEGIQVRGGIFGLSHREIAVRDLERIDLVLAGSMNHDTVHNLVAVCKDGSRITLAKRIRPKSSADSLLRRIQRILHP